MTHEETIIRLDELLAGDLPEGEEREVRLHLMECADCRAELDWLRQLRRRAEELPREVAPPSDLWSGIAPRLRPRDTTITPLPVAGRVPQPADGPELYVESGEVVPGVIPLRPRAPRLPRWPLAAAAMIAVALGSSTLTYLILRPAASTSVAVAPTPAGTTAPMMGTGGTRTALAAFAPAEAEYRQAVDELAAILATRRGTLAPETVATLERNLVIIDEAIRQSRAALEADPNSAELAQMLTHAYDAKVETLRHAVSL